MLFGYPVEATAENWLHDAVLGAVVSVHEHVAAKKRLPAWPAIVPQAHRGKLERRTGLKDRLYLYGKALKKLEAAERQTVLAAVTAQNRVPELLARQCDCHSLSDLPVGIREAAKSLFTFAFSLLTDFGIRQRQYEAVCKGIPERVCPFCGCEALEAPGAPQEDLDHYMPRSRYPFAAANLRNLAPMGGRCNAAYKRTQDPLRRDDGVRRLARDPFAADRVTASLVNSVIDEQTTGPLVSDWIIDFAPTNEAVEAWDEIFHVRERWKLNVLDAKTFTKWLGDFQSFCKHSAVQAAADADVVAAIGKYQAHLSDCGYEGYAFLKAAVFELLFQRCAAGSPRLLPIFRDLTGAPQL